MSEVGDRGQGFLEGWSQVGVWVFRLGAGGAPALWSFQGPVHLSLPAPQNVPPDLAICCFVLEQSLSVRALQEMLANTVEAGVEVRLLRAGWVGGMGGRTWGSFTVLSSSSLCPAPRRPSIWISG